MEIHRMKELFAKACQLFYDPKYRIIWLASRGFYDHLSDEAYLRKVFEPYVGYPLDLNNPKTFNEKIQWLKLYDRRPVYTTMADKYAVKDYVASVIGPQYIIPTLGVWDRFDDIDFHSLPDQFVLKCTHDSGGLVIVKDKRKMDIRAARKKISSSLKRDYYLFGREWPYVNVPRRIICEKYMMDETGELRDYKVLCFHGEPKLIEFHQGRFTDQRTQDFFDTAWNKTPITQVGLQNSKTPIPCPQSLQLMLDYSRLFSQDIPHIRIDWYSINGQLFFGEFTFYDASGFDPFDDPADDAMLGSWITLHEKPEE